MASATSHKTSSVVNAGPALMAGLQEDRQAKVARPE